MKLVNHLPNALTILNLALGLSAILLTFRVGCQYPQRILFLILMGGLCDFLDGFVARKLNATSAIGKQLDSFADLVTFGVAPVVFLHCISSGSLWITMASALFLIAGAWRLANYNTNEFDGHFRGLPITMAGILLSGVSLVCYYLGVGCFATVLMVVILALMMISSFKLKRISVG